MADRSRAIANCLKKDMFRHTQFGNGDSFDEITTALGDADCLNRTVAPLRRPNAELRTREYLRLGEIEALMDGTKRNRQPHRDATMREATSFKHAPRRGPSASDYRATREPGRGKIALPLNCAVV